MIHGFSTAMLPRMLAQSAVPVCLAPNGTVATNGIITIGTALPTTYSGGIWLRLPAGAVSGGSAGLYWAVMSSTTVGQVYANFVDPASRFTPYIPTGLVNAVGSNSAYTQTTATDITLVNVNLPGGSLGLNGAVEVNRIVSATNPANANNKLMVVKLGGTQVAQDSLSSVTVFSGRSITSNRGSQSAQVSNRANLSVGASGTSNATYVSVDTATDKAVTLTAQIAAATDFMVIESFDVRVMPS